VTNEELISELAWKTGLTQADCQKTVKALQETVMECMEKGDSIVFREFGVFQVSFKEARSYRNPQDGTIKTVDNRMVPVFKPSKNMKQRALKAPQP